MSASTTSVTRFLDPFGRPSGLPLCPGANGRPRGFCAFISTTLSPNLNEPAPYPPDGPRGISFEMAQSTLVFSAPTARSPTGFPATSKKRISGPVALPRFDLPGRHNGNVQIRCTRGAAVAVPSATNYTLG